MSDLPQQDTINQYVADGIEDVYTYSFLIPEDKDISVYVTPTGSQANDESDIKILNVNYSVQNSGNVDGGTISFLPEFVPLSGETVTLSRSVEASINTNYTAAQTITGPNLDDSLQREMLVIQQNQSKIDDVSLRYQFSSFLPESVNRNVIPTLDPGYIWKGSPSGGVVAAFLDEDPDCSTLRSELSSEAQGSDGAGLIGYYNETDSEPTTVKEFLNNLDLDGKDELQKSEGIYGDDVGVGTNVWEVNPDPAYTSIVSGTRVFVRSNKDSVTGPATLNISGLGAFPIEVKESGGQGIVELYKNMIVSGMICEFMYDGAFFVLLNPHSYIEFLTPFPYEFEYRDSGLLIQSITVQAIANGSNTIVTNINLPKSYATNNFHVSVTPHNSSGIYGVFCMFTIISNNSIQLILKSVQSGQHIANNTLIEVVTVGRTD